MIELGIGVSLAMVFIAGYVVAVDMGKRQETRRALEFERERKETHLEGRVERLAKDLREMGRKVSYLELKSGSWRDNAAP